MDDWVNIEELERKVTRSDSVIVEETRSVEAFPDYVGEDVRNVLPEKRGVEQAESQDEQDIAFVRKLQKW